ncbi:DUF6056 family protein [Citrobacter freundii]|uniref:DUF6056 family protein n=1 Tax=Citrobacter freundii TaxID=546 RepID=UPI0012902FFA|nr:DUF6056 family protein [Citrobacter freundii]MEB2474742.1 DUF6056 family protein [Citrobacter freundii]
MSIDFNKYKLALSLLIIYFLTFVINSLVPLISDDFSYMRIGIDLSSRYHHYMTWSGRIEADIISSAILQFNSVIVKSLINAAPLVALCFFVHKIISLYSESDPLITPLITFSCYFLFNPNLGQTTFWIVGSANYLWTTTFCIVFTYSICLLTTLDRITKTKEIFIYLSALLAGCSSEASAALMVSASALAILNNIYISNKNKRIAIIAFVFCLAGFIVLIFAPGNKVRLASDVFSTWRGMGIFEKVEYHFYERVPSLIRYIKFEFAIAAVCVISYIGYNKFKFSTSVFCLYVAPIIGFSFILVILAFSPYTPERSVNILTVILAIPICALVNKLTKHVKIAITFSFVIVMLINWTHVYSSYSRVYIQDIMRRSYMQDMIEKGVDDITIPQYNFSNFFKELDLWDLFNNEYEIARYFGAKKINVTPVNIDYSYLLTQPNYTCKITDEKSGEKTYSINFYEDSFNDVLLIGETASSTGTIDELTKVNFSVITDVRKYQYELPSNNVSLFGRNLLVVRTPAINIDKAKEVSFLINGMNCVSTIDR